MVISCDSKVCPFSIFGCVAFGALASIFTPASQIPAPLRPLRFINVGCVRVLSARGAGYLCGKRSILAKGCLQWSGSPARECGLIGMRYPTSPPEDYGSRTLFPSTAPRVVLLISQSREKRDCSQAPLLRSALPCAGFRRN